MLCLFDIKDWGAAASSDCAWQKWSANYRACWSHPGQRTGTGGRDIRDRDTGETQRQRF